MFKIKQKVIIVEVGIYFDYRGTIYKIVEIIGNRYIRVAYKDPYGDTPCIKCYLSGMTTDECASSIKKGNLKLVLEDEILLPDLKAYKYPENVQAKENT